MSSTVITIRIPKRLRDRMRKVDVNWSSEIRKFIEEKVRMYELLELVDEIQEEARERRVKVDSTQLIREDREGR